MCRINTSQLSEKLKLYIYEMLIRFVISNGQCGSDWATLKVKSVTPTWSVTESSCISISNGSCLEMPVNGGCLGPRSYTILTVS